MAVQADYISAVQQLYVSYFGRPADYYGLDNFTKQLAAIDTAGTLVDFKALAGAANAASPTSPLGKLINSFSASTEAAALYGTDTTIAGTSKFVAAVYKNILGREADVEGLTYWVNAIQTGGVTRANAAAAITEGALSNTTAQGLLDAQTVINKNKVATAFTAAIDTTNEINGYSGETAAAAARAMLVEVNSTTNVTTFQATVEATLVNIVKGINPGTNQNLTTGLDTLTGGTGDDNFVAVIDGTTNAVTTTLTGLDTINGAGGVDALTINVLNGTGAAGTAVTALPTINLTNVETVNLRSAVGLAADVSTWTGVQTVNVTQIAKDGTGAGNGAEAIKVTAGSSTDINISVKAVGDDVKALGGKNVTVDLSDFGAGDVVTVGNGTVASGAVKVSTVGAASVAATDVILGAVNVTGGATIDVTQKATSSAAAAAADKTGATITQSATTVTAGASTTTVSLKQDTAVAEVLARDAVAEKAATQEVSFTKALKGETVTLTVDGKTIAFTANKDLSAAEVASAFANLVEGAWQGKASTTLGIYTDTGGLTQGWTSGAVQTVDANTSKVVFSTTTDSNGGLAGIQPFAITTSVSGGATVTATASAVVDGVAAVTAKTGVLGINNGAVSVQDSAGHTLTTVNVDGYANGSNIGNVTATTNLSTLSLKNAQGTASMTVADTAATLGLTVEKLGAAGAPAVLTLTSAPTTLNITSTGANTINLTAALTETLNVAGTGLLNISTTDLAAVKTVKVTGTAGLTLNANGADTITSVDTTGTTGTVTASIEGDRGSYTGGAGVDKVTVANANTAITKAISTGAGNDVVTLNVTAGSVVVPTADINGGEGSDIIKMASADAANLSTSATFEGKISGFEKLELNQAVAASADSVNLDNLDDIAYVITNGQAAAGVAAGTAEVQTYTVTSGVTSTKVGQTQTIDFTGVDITGNGNLTIGGVVVAVTAGDNAAAIAGKVQTALDNANVTGATQIVKATVAGNIVTIAFATSDASPAALTVVNTSATATGTLPPTGTVAQAYSANAKTITIGGVNVNLVSGDLDSDGVAVAGSGDDTTAEVATKILAALDASATYNAALTTLAGSTITATWAATGNQAATTLTANGSGVVIGAVGETDGTATVGQTAQTLTKMLNNGTLELKGAGFLTTVDMKDATGAADAFNIVTNAATGANVGTVAVAGVETINFNVTDTDTSATGVSSNTVTLKDAAAKTVNVAGAGDLNLVLDSGNLAITLIDASTATGALTVTTVSGDAAATTVKGGAGDDVLTAAGANDVLLGGAGADTLAVTTGAAVTLTGGAGEDWFDVSGFNGTVGGAATITDLAKGEVIQFVDDIAANFNSAKVTLISEATFTEYVNEAMKVASVNSTKTFGLAWFQFGDNTFIVQNMAADNTFTDGSDIIVKLTGKLDLSASSYNSDDHGTLWYL